MEGTQWAVFEPNDMRLWMQLRISTSNFLTRVWRDGALFGASPDQAFYVKCDAETNPPDLIEAGQVQRAAIDRQRPGAERIRLDQGQGAGLDDSAAAVAVRTAQEHRAGAGLDEGTGAGDRGALERQKVERAIGLSVEKYCSASAMLARTATITHDFEVIDTGGTSAGSD